MFYSARCPDARVSRRFGPNAEMFLVDVRSGALGEDQLEWVTEAVEESTRTWKVRVWLSFYSLLDAHRCKKVGGGVRACGWGRRGGVALD